MTFEPITIFAQGQPRTKGSLKPIHIKVRPGVCRVTLQESGEYSDAWKQALIAAIRAAASLAGSAPNRYPGAVVVDAVYRYHRRPGTADDQLPWPTRLSGEWAHGDEDKLRRVILDALTQSGLIKDDSQSIGGRNLKRWADAGQAPGATFRVRAATPADVEMAATVEAALWS